MTLPVRSRPPVKSQQGQMPVQKSAQDSSSQPVTVSNVRKCFTILPGVVKAECEYCLDNVRRKCKFCACCECGGKNAPDKQIMCDECDCSYHLWCLEPPLEEVPEEEEW